MKSGQSQVRQTIHIPDLAGVSHIDTMRTLREFVPQVRQRDVPAVPLKQSVDAIGTLSTLNRLVLLGFRLGLRIEASA
jgi:hypothetical protein